MDEKKPREFISLTKAAAMLGVGYTSARRYYKMLLEDNQVEENQSIKKDTGHIALGLTKNQIEYVRANYMTPKKRKERSEKIVSVNGVFYLILLVPEFSNTRIKAGFTDNLEKRISSHRQVAPTCKILKTFPCIRSWEGYFLSLVGKHGGCLRTEVFDIKEIKKLIKDIEAAIRLVGSK